ncbi:MAG: hypothetical protein HFJ58_02255 [Clostridia bacterium]|nr:hypothetical protein [Clostridia bacterium]
MGIKVKELNDFECGYIISGLVELKKVYSQNNANEDEYNSVLGLLEDFKNNKVYIGEKI